MNSIIKEISDQNIAESASLTITKTLIGQAEDLAAEHEAFNTNYVIGGRKALYSLLGKIAVLVEQFERAIDKDDLIKTVRKNLQEQYGIKTQENTSDITVLVRYITRADRKTAHVYARAIETARANQIAPTQFAGYLEQAGGVERIRASGVEVKDCDSLKPCIREKQDLIRKYLNARREFPLTTFELSEKQQVQLGSGSDLSALLCSWRNGRYYVLAKLSPDADLEKKMLEVMANQLSNDLKQARQDIEIFYKKAMKKRSRNSIKSMIKRRPVLAETVLRSKKLKQFKGDKKCI